MVLFESIRGLACTYKQGEALSVSHLRGKKTSIMVTLGEKPEASIGVMDMKRVVGIFLILLCLGVMGSGLALAAPVSRGFGFGGAMAMAFFPDMTGINDFMLENGFDPFCDFLIGAGGNGRGGVIGGLSFGGIGWGVLSISETEDRYAEFVFGGGGFDLGAAIGGDEGSVLTLGVVFGGGANVLSLTGPFVQAIEPEGIVPAPTSYELVRATAFVQPYVSMSAQLLPWMGFEFRIGYVFPVFGIDVGDSLGIPAPSLELSGPTVSLGLVFGGIGSGASNRDHDEFDDEDRDEDRRNDKVTMVSEGSFVVADGAELVIENGLGDIVISSYEASEDETTPGRLVEWQAARTAKEKRIDELQTIIESTETATTLRTSGDGLVEYVLRIPAGIDLKVKNGVGAITLVGHEAQTIIVENGVGEVSVQGVTAAALIIAAGIGEVDVADVDAQTLIVDMGIGELKLELPVSTSARLIAKAGLGDVTIDRFPGMTGGVRGFFGRSGDVTLGLGERMIELHVGLGVIDVNMQQP